MKQTMTCHLQIQCVFVLFVFTVIRGQYLQYGQYQSKLYNAHLTCGYDSMTLTVQSRLPFRGHVYIKDYYRSPRCRVSGNGEKVVSLKIYYHQSFCGVSNMGNGTFATKVIIQRHPRIVLGDDESYKVLCTFPEVLQEKQVLSNTIEVTGEFPRGLLKGLSPEVRLKMLDLRDNEVTSAKIGQELVFMVDIDEDSLFGIFATDIIASSGSNTHSLTLVNSEGCTVEPVVFGQLNKRSSSKDLQGRFNAFKFPSDNIVNFKVTIKFCVDECQTAHCTNGTSRGYGRRKRSAKEILIAEEDNIEHRIPKDVTLQISIVVIDTETEDKSHTPSSVDDDSNIIPAGQSGIPLYLPSHHVPQENVYPYYLDHDLYLLRPLTTKAPEPEIFPYQSYQGFAKRSGSYLPGEYVVLSSGIEVRRHSRSIK